MGGTKDGGLTRYRRGSMPPSIRIDSVNIDDGPYTDFNAVPKITTGHHLVIFYRPLDFKTLKEKQQFQYQFLTADGQTIKRALTKERWADWTPKKTGTYTFSVQAIDRDLNYSKPARVTFRVVPPGYLNGWIAIPSGGGLLVLLVGFLIYGGRYYTEKRESQRLRDTMLAQEQKARETLEAKNVQLENANKQIEARNVEIHQSYQQIQEAKEHAEMARLDGTLVTTGSDTAVAIATHTGGIAIGAVNGDSKTHLRSITGTSLNHFAGSIDDVAIFNRALHSDEISELAGSVLGGTETDLVGYWTFDEGTGTTTEDLSPNDNHGTFVNGPTWPARDTDVTTDSDGNASYAWTINHDTVYVVEFEATVTTTEGLTLTDTDLATVTIGAGRPVATTGGPYTGGIKGGDFSPVQFVGNAPDATELDTVGVEVTIEEWEWVFDKTVPYNQGLEFDGDAFVSLGNLSIDATNGLTVTAWVRSDTANSTVISTANDTLALGINASGKPYFQTTTSDVETTVTSDDAIANDGIRHLDTGPLRERAKQGQER
ncbi:hypothetical protein HYR99_02500 [Candidatus Poribacteria bacterium]|nr:hypothetical protein [Candidatus Poribacteria bacterium]